MSVQLRILLMCRLELERNHAIDIRRLERLERYVGCVSMYVRVSVCVRYACVYLGVEQRSRRNAFDTHAANQSFNCVSNQP